MAKVGHNRGLYLKDEPDNRGQCGHFWHGLVELAVE